MVHRIPITQARVNLGQVVRRVRVNKECFILEKDGIPVAGILDVDEMEDYLELKDPKIKKRIAQSAGQYQKGQARSARDFLAELQKGNKRK